MDMTASRFDELVQPLLDLVFREDLLGPLERLFRRRLRR
jgi:hypothetical protein